MEYPWIEIILASIAILAFAVLSFRLGCWLDKAWKGLPKPLVERRMSVPYVVEKRSGVDRRVEQVGEFYSDSPWSECRDFRSGHDRRRING